MKTKGVILITLLLIVSRVNAQKQEIGRLRTQTITLSRKAPKDKTEPPRFWILVESDGGRTKIKGPMGIDKTPPMDVTTPPLDVRANVIDSDSIPSSAGQFPITTFLPKHRYSIAYEAISPAAEDLWLHVQATPVGGMGFLKDMGEMKWEKVDRMPTLVLRPITSGISIGRIHGVRSVGPQGLVVRAVAGHVYAAQIKDGRTDYRVIFRIDSIDSKGDCSITWKCIPSKWAGIRRRNPTSRSTLVSSIRR